MAKKNVTGKCPYCPGEDVTENAEQYDDRYVLQECSDCNGNSAKSNINGAAYPLVDPADSRSGWVVFNPAA